MKLCEADTAGDPRSLTSLIISNKQYGAFDSQDSTRDKTP